MVEGKSFPSIIYWYTITSVYFVLCVFKLLVLQVSSLAQLWAYHPFDVAHITTSLCCNRSSCFHCIGSVKMNNV